MTKTARHRPALAVAAPSVVEVPPSPSPPPSTTPPPQSRRSGLPFRVKLAVLAIAAAILPVAVVGVIAVDLNRRALTEANQERLFATIEDVAHRAGDLLDSHRNVLSTVGGVLADVGRPIDDRIALIGAVVNGSRSTDEVALYDAKGAWLDTVRKGGAAGNQQTFAPKLSPAITAIARQEGFAAGPVEQGVGSLGSSFLVVEPIVAPSATWYVASRVPLAPLQEALEQIGHERLGRGHSLLVVDTERRILADSQRERTGMVATGEEIAAMKGVSGGALDEGILVFGEYDGPSGVMLGAVRSMVQVPWAVVAEVPRDVAYAAITRTRNVLWGVVIGAAALAILAGLVMAQRITKPIRALVGFAGDLAQRRFDRRVDVDTGDELSLLGDALSQAASDLAASDEIIRRELAIRSDLGRYLPGQLVERIVDRQQSLELGGQRREVTVLFADVVGFTQMVERHSAEEVVRLLNELFTILTEIVFRHEGTVDKFIGDCVMAFWGAPRAMDDHAERALLAAQDMMRWLEVGNEAWQETYGIRIQLAIGINTGEAVIGNFGSESRMEYTAVGDVVNVAARLEAIARPQQILVSRETKDASGGKVALTPMGARRVSGRAEPVELYEVEG